MAIQDLLQGPLRVVNTGLESFAADLKKRGIPVVQMDWSPPAGGNPKLRALLSKLGS